jgi:hypothetical protein
MTMGAGAGMVWGAVIEAAQGRRDNLFNRGESERNRRWQQYMYERRYQMEVADLRAAGLNPALAYGNSPAAVPQGAQASAAPGGSIVGSALQAGKFEAEVNKLNMEIANLGAQYGLNSTQMIHLNQAITTEIEKAKMLEQQGKLLQTEQELNNMTINVIKNVEKSLGSVSQDDAFSRGVSEILKVWILKR